MADAPHLIIQTLIIERDELKAHCLRMRELLDKIGFPPGHFYSPLVDDRNVHAIDVLLIDPALDDLTLSLGTLSSNVRLLSCPVQEVPLEFFERLEGNDILFIDSSHVAKTRSDVNHYLFKIFPLLRPRVIVHIHDILYPFEDLPDWVLTEHRNWNEACVIRAFLQSNARFQILYWNNYSFHHLKDKLREAMPLCLESEGGSLWLQVQANA